VIVLARLVPIIATFALAADAPPDGERAASPPPSASLSLAGDDDIRAAFLGKAACSPQPWPVGVGPHEFRADGAYVRQRDIASAHGRYTVGEGRICVTLAGSDRPDFCLAVLKNTGGYLFRLDDQPPATSAHAPVAVTPCPLPDH
jgi:hypothetical protein